MDLDDANPYILKIPEVLSPAECRVLIDRIEAAQPVLATVNTLHGAQIKTNVRNNERVIFTDMALADLLLERVREHLPAEFRGMTLAGANEMFRCYRYKPGMRFIPHADGAFQRNAYERSWYTFLVYLNEAFTGGETSFLVVPPVSIRPLTGLGVLFQHPLIHEGCEVKTGVKYVIRTDIMYRQPGKLF
ncbi:MAG: 2OG-Fe(II) oxygenase [Blastocatellia bacterium]|nr:2OG-Fe(II) oxygenase [Blastocatellia bacterium]